MSLVNKKKDGRVPYMEHIDVSIMEYSILRTHRFLKFSEKKCKIFMKRLSKN